MVELNESTKAYCVLLGTQLVGSHSPLTLHCNSHAGPSARTFQLSAKQRPKQSRATRLQQVGTQPRPSWLSRCIAAPAGPCGRGRHEGGAAQRQLSIKWRAHPCTVRTTQVPTALHCYLHQCRPTGAAPRRHRSVHAHLEGGPTGPRLLHVGGHALAQEGGGAVEGAIIQPQRGAGSGHSGLGAALARQCSPHSQLQGKGQQQGFGGIDRQDGGPARICGWSSRGKVRKWAWRDR